MESRYSIRSADLVIDRQEIISLWTRCKLVQSDQEYFYDWICEQSPYGKVKCWLLIYVPTGKVIGSIALSFRKMKIKNSVVLAGRAFGFCVEKEHRFLSPSLMLVKILLSEVNSNKISFVYTISPFIASSGFKRAGFKKLSELKSYRKIIGFSGIIQSRFPHIPKFANVMLSMIADCFLTLFSKKIKTKLSKCRLVQIKEFDSRFDDFWNRVEKSFEFNTVRESVFLNWRFFKRKTWFEYKCDALIDNNIIKAYVVYYLENKIVQIVDVFSENFTCEHLMLELLARRLKKEGFTHMSMAATGSSKFNNLLKLHGFADKKSWGLPLYELYVAKCPSLNYEITINDMDKGFLASDDFFDFF